MRTAIPMFLIAVAMTAVTACSSSGTEQEVTTSTAAEPEISTSIAADITTTAAAPEIVAVSGEGSCIEVEPVGDERNRYECIDSLDDERVSGPSLVLVTTVDRSVYPTEMAGSFRLVNDGGVWEGDWTGVIEGNGYHIVEGVMSGFGGYDGLSYRATWAYFDWPATVTGTIEPTQ